MALICLLSTASPADIASVICLYSQSQTGRWALWRLVRTWTWWLGEQESNHLLQGVPSRSLSHPLKSHVCVLSGFIHVQLFVTLRTIAHQAPLSRGFFRQEYWSGLPCPPPGDLPDPGIEPESLMSSEFADRVFTTNTTWKAQTTCPFPNAPEPSPSGRQSPGTRKCHLYLYPPLTAVELTFSYEWR